VKEEVTRPSAAAANPVVHTHFFRLRWQQAPAGCEKLREKNGLHYLNEAAACTTLFCLYYSVIE
jgi:hypothetical protein